MTQHEQELERLQRQLNDPEVAGRKLYWGDWWLPRVRARIIRRIVELQELIENEKGKEE